MKHLVKISAETAAEVTGRYELDEEIESLLSPEIQPAGFIQRLLEDSLYLDCVRFIAHGLPKREAVWWACLATRYTHTPETESLRQQTLSITEAWVKQPGEDYRLQAYKMAEKAKHKTPDSWAAMAAYWSTGSVNESDSFPVPPPPYLFAHAVTGAICLSAADTSEDDINDRYVRFIGQGLDLAAGGRGKVLENPLEYLLSEEGEQATVS
ncbi:MAG: DUF6931 family protein [Endozoicomonas sp.]|uniref:DUF6931 family protein n=1 Tax=Endozoicomonas sp. TaxID=1892382 RepID=UPI003D9B5BFE